MEGTRKDIARLMELDFILIRFQRKECLMISETQYFNRLFKSVYCQPCNETMHTNDHERTTHTIRVI